MLSSVHITELLKAKLEVEGGTDVAAWFSREYWRVAGWILIESDLDLCTFLTTKQAKLCITRTVHFSDTEVVMIPRGVMRPYYYVLNKHSEMFGNFLVIAGRNPKYFTLYE